MRLVKQHHTLSVQKVEQNKTTTSKHGPLLPNSIRCIICGPSNCGKTNLILSLIYDPVGVKFYNIYIFSRSLGQPKYRTLLEIFSGIEDIGCYAYESNENIPKPSEAKPNSIFVFDDVTCDKQDIIRAYFCMGRHSNVDSFYLCQSYCRVPKHLIRDNANLIILFKQDHLNTKKIYEDHVGSDMDFKTFLKICQKCWVTNYGFLVIDKDRDINDGRYRKGFDVYIIP